MRREGRRGLFQLLLKPQCDACLFCGEGVEPEEKEMVGFIPRVTDCTAWEDRGCCENEMNHYERC